MPWCPLPLESLSIESLAVTHCLPPPQVPCCMVPQHCSTPCHDSHLLSSHCLLPPRHRAGCTVQRQGMGGRLGTIPALQRFHCSSLERSEAELTIYYDGYEFASPFCYPHTLLADVSASLLFLSLPPLLPTGSHPPMLKLAFLPTVRWL